jgi:Carboxypeptidase regulatory-like domain/TonB dependent receptor
MNSPASKVKVVVFFSSRKAAPALGFTIAMLVLCLPLSSQTSSGRIEGAVVDQSGGTIAGATVDVTNVQTGVVRNLATDQAGEYVAPNLLPGTYTVRGTAKGFKAIERTDILLEVDKNVRVDLQLSPGEVTQTVEVTGAVPMVDSASVTLGGTLSNDTINELPLNGRNFEYLLSLRPGVEQYPGGGSWTQASNGLRGEDQNWVVDGLDNNESLQGLPVINSPGTAGDAATILPIDAIQEFNVEENPKAEWGWRPGAVVNVGLKSGTNGIHGTAYAFGRKDSWDAKNYFNTGPQTPLNFEQWGGTAGGPIVKNKLFYFAGFEEQRYVVGNSFTIRIPTSAAGVGADVSIPDAEAALAAANVPLSPLSLKLLPLFGTTNSPTGTEFTSFPATNKSDNVLAKVDYAVNSHHTLSGSYFFGNDNAVTQDFFLITQPYWLSTFKIRTMAASGHWIWTPNSRWVNEARVGFVRYTRPIGPVDQTVPATHYGINTGVTNPLALGMPTINVIGLGQLGGFRAWPADLGPDNNFDFLDQLSYSRGKHAFKFGGEIRYARMAVLSPPVGRGQFLFTGGVSGPTSLEDFLAGTPAVGFLGVGNAVRHYRSTSYAVFVQDDWRIKPKVTLNLGLRWEYTGPVGEAGNLVANFIPGSPTGMVQVGHGISSAYNREKTNFAPRAGLAWDISGNGTTVIRAGGGLFYDMLPVVAFTNDQTGSLMNAHTPGVGKIPTGAVLVLPNGQTIQGSGNISTANFSYPGSALNWTLAGPVFPPNATLTCSGAANGNPCSIFGVARNFSTPYVGMWTLTAQHAFSNRLSLEVAYVGNHGDDLSGVLDINQINPRSPGENTPTCQHCEAIADRPYGAEYPYLAFINDLRNPYISNYHGLQASFTGRNFHNLSFVAGYTYAHALGDFDTSLLNATPQDSRNIAAQYGNSNFDIRHRFTLTTTWNIPGKKTPGQILEGWQINSIVTLQTGAPWAVSDNSQDISKTGELEDTWDFFGNPGDFTSGPTPTPFFAGSGNSATGQETSNPACNTQAEKMGASTQTSLAAFGCYAKGKSIMIPPATGTFGTMGRNIFRDSGFRNWDLSVFKSFKFKERFTAQFRAEFFNVLNHPNFANPAVNGEGDPSSPGPGGFGCGCATPDAAATNPVLGSGGARDMQLGLKLIF